jgi:hypothetical protein
VYLNACLGRRNMFDRSKQFYVPVPARTVVFTMVFRSIARIIVDLLGNTLWVREPVTLLLAVSPHARNI